MADEIMSGQAAPNQAPATAPAPTDAGGQLGPTGAPAQFDQNSPDLNGLPADQSNAFAKKWAAERGKLEQNVRTQLESEYRARLAEMTPPPEPPPPLEEDTAELERINQDILSKLYDNPIQAMAEANRIMGERKAARDQAIQAQWDYHARNLAARYPDWQNVRPQMEELLKQHPDLAEQPQHLERVYQLAKRYAPPPTTDQILQDPAIMERAKAQLRDQIISEYVSGKKGAQAATPPLMGGTSGGAPPAMPPTMPRTWADARRNAQVRMGGQ